MDGALQQNLNHGKSSAFAFERTIAETRVSISIPRPLRHPRTELSAALIFALVSALDS